MPNQNPDLTWLIITDFRQGIIANANFAYASLDNSAPVPAQKGAAQANGTYGCLGLPSGGLGPMPGQTVTYDPPSLPGSISPSTISGLFAIGTVSSSTGGSPGDEVVYLLEGYNGTNHYAQIVALQTGGLWNHVIQSFGPSASALAAGSPGFAFTGGYTLTNPSDATGLTPGPAGLVMCWFDRALSAGAFLGIYPDPTNPSGGITPHDYSATLPGSKALPGICFTHQGRIVFLQQNNYTWTSASDVLIGSYDNFYYTDPAGTAPDNGSGSTLAQDEVFVPEMPIGISAFGSVNAGELFCVKRLGGAFVLAGDLNNPVITWLGGVEPAYALDQITVSTPIGMVYISAVNGLWAWNGGQTAQKLSDALNDDFYANVLGNVIGPKTTLARMGNLLFLPNNWIMDLASGGFWRLDNVAVPFCWYAASVDGEGMYAAPATVASGKPAIFRYDRGTPASTWQWTSFPIRPPQAENDPYPNRNLLMNEIVVRVQGVGSVQVSVIGPGGAVNSTTSPAGPLAVNSSTQPLEQRFTIGEVAQDMAVRVTMEGSMGGTAPVLWSLAIGFRDGQSLVSPT